MDFNEFYEKHEDTLIKICITARKEHGPGMLLINGDDIKDERVNSQYLPISHIPPDEEYYPKMIESFQKNDGKIFFCFCSGDQSIIVEKDLSSK